LALGTRKRERGGVDNYPALGTEYRHHAPGRGEKKEAVRSFRSLPPPWKPRTGEREGEERKKKGFDLFWGSRNAGTREEKRASFFPKDLRPPPGGQVGRGGGKKKHKKRGEKVIADYLLLKRLFQPRKRKEEKSLFRKRPFPQVTKPRREKGPKKKRRSAIHVLLSKRYHLAPGRKKKGGERKEGSAIYHSLP